MLAEVFRHPRQRLPYDIVQDFALLLDEELPLLDAGHVEEILHHRPEPHGIRMDVGQQAFHRFAVDSVHPFEEELRSSGDGGERGSEVVGDAPQESVLEPFLFHVDAVEFFGLAQFLAFHREHELGKNGLEIEHSSFATSPAEQSILRTP